MSSSFRLILIILTAILLSSTISPPVFAADDSNSGNLTPIINTSSASAMTNQTLDALNQLSQGVNDTQYRQLENQLETQLHNGNNIGAQQTLSQLKNYASTDQGSKLSPSLRDLIQSLTGGSNGLSVDPSILSQLIGNPGANGMPAGLEGMDPTRAANDLLTLSSLTQNINPQTGMSLAQDSSELQKSILSGLFGGGSSSSQTPQLPKPPPIQISQLGSTGAGHFLPNISPSFAGVLGVSGGIGLPVIPVILIAIVGIAAFLFLFRNRLLLLGRRVTPNSFKAKLGKPEIGLNLKNPRDLIIYYFRKAVRVMQKRGVPRLDFETHREFSDKCSPRPESQPISDISVLYEKAMFSGREVVQTEADRAGQCALQVEEGPGRTSREQRSAGADRMVQVSQTG